MEEENIESTNVSLEGKLKVTVIAAVFELVKFIPPFHAHVFKGIGCTK